jgi:hypothetical protein
MSSFIWKVVCLQILASKPIVCLILLDIFTKIGKNEPTTVEHKINMWSAGKYSGIWIIPSSKWSGGDQSEGTPRNHDDG